MILWSIFCIFTTKCYKIMKKIYFLLLAFILCTVSYSQDFKIIDQATITVNGSYVYVVDDPSTNDISHNLWVENVSGQTLNLNCRRVEIDIVPGTENATCWEVCPPAIPAGDDPDLISGNTVTIADGDFDYSFAGHLYPEGTPGCSHYRYIFYDINDPTIIDSVDIYFNHGESCNQVASIDDTKELSVEIYPNPANDFINISLENNNAFKTEVKITNLLGSTVYSQLIEDGISQLEVPTVDMDNGLYFISLHENGKSILTKKIQVVK